MFAVVVGRAGAERTQVEAALQAAGLECAGAHPAPCLAVLLEDAAHPPWPALPTIVISSKRDIDSFTNAITSGAAAYLTTPLDSAELIAAARRLARWQAPPLGAGTRTRSRRPLLLDVDLEIDGRLFRGHLVDVSASGCRVETRAQVSRGAAIRLTPRALGTSTGIALGGKVTRTRRVDTARTSIVEVALRFNGTSALLAGRIFGAPGLDHRQSLRVRR